MANEANKWEARERQLMQRIDELQAQAAGNQGASGRPVVCSGNQVSRQMLFSNDYLTTTHCTMTMPNITSSLTASPQTDHSPALATPTSTPLTYQRSSSSVVSNTITGHTIIGSNSGTFATSHTIANGTDTLTTYSLSPHASPFAPLCSMASSPVLAREVPGSYVDPLSLALLAQQIPPLPKFNGDNLGEEGESFSKWIEQLELIAGTCQWSDQAKLVNLVTRIRGQAYSFYRSCTPDQRASYGTLVAALKERFTPVQIQSVQSSKFHERKQLPTESVDSYAQDLKKLYSKVYSGAQRGSKEAEAMGRSVLAYQFVAGLLPHLKF